MPRKEKFYRIPRSVLTLNLPSRVKVLYARILDCCRKDEASCYPSRQRLVKDSGHISDTIRKDIATLKAANLLTTIKQNIGGMPKQVYTPLELPDESFIQIPATVMNDRELTETAKLVYGCILWYGREGKRESRAAQATLAQYFGLKQATVSRAIEALEERGFLKVERHPGESVGNGRKTNRYYPQILPGQVQPKWIAKQPKWIDNDPAKVDSKTAKMDDTPAKVDEPPAKVDDKPSQSGSEHTLNRPGLTDPEGTDPVSAEIGLRPLPERGENPSNRENNESRKQRNSETDSRKTDNESESLDTDDVASVTVEDSAIETIESPSVVRERKRKARQGRPCDTVSDAAEYFLEQYREQWPDQAPPRMRGKERGQLSELRERFDPQQLGDLIRCAVTDFESLKAKLEWTSTLNVSMLSSFSDSIAAHTHKPGQSRGNRYRGRD